MIVEKYPTSNEVVGNLIPSYEHHSLFDEKTSQVTKHLPYPPTKRKKKKEKGTLSISQDQTM